MRELYEAWFANWLWLIDKVWLTRIHAKLYWECRDLRASCAPDRQTGVAS